MATKTEVINIKVPATLFKEIENLTQGRFLSKGEFTRAAIVRFLSSLGLFKSFSVRMREIREHVQTKVKEKFTPEEEINELREVRKHLWKRRG